MARKGRGREGERSFRPRESDLPQGILRARQKIEAGRSQDFFFFLKERVVEIGKAERRREAGKLRVEVGGERVNRGQ